MSLLVERINPADAYPPVAENSGRLWSEWSNPDTYTNIIEPIGISASAHGKDVRKTVKLLWDANCTSISKEEFAGTSTTAFDLRVTNIAKNIRSELPLELSLYHLVKDERLVLMPTIPDYTDILFPEDVSRIKDENYPEETLPLVIWLNQRQARPRYEKTKSTSIFSRASSNVIRLGEFLAQNFGKELNVEYIINELGLTSSKEVFSYIGKLNELFRAYPGELKFVINRIDGNSEQEALYTLDYALDDENGSSANSGESNLKIKYPEIKNLLDTYLEFDTLAMIDPLGVNPDARMAKDSDPTKSWEYFYTSLAVAQEACKASIQELIELQTKLPDNKKVKSIIASVQKAYEDTSTRYEIQHGAPKSIAHLINDVNIDKLLELLSDSESPQEQETPENAWQMVKNDRDCAHRLVLLKDYLQTNSFAERDMGIVISSLINIDAILNESELQHNFYTSKQDLTTIKNEIIRVNELRKISISYINYGPLFDPKNALKKAKVGKDRDMYQQLFRSFKRVHDSHVKLFSLLSPQKERSSVATLLMNYKQSHELQSKQSLSGGKVVTEMRDISIPGRGNLERIEVIGMKLYKDNIIPLRVISRKYRVMSGPLCILRTGLRGEIQLGDDGLPILYSDNIIVANDDEAGTYPAVFHSL